MGRTPELAEHIERTAPAVGFCAAARADVYVPAIGDRPVFRVDEDDTGFRVGSPASSSPTGPTSRRSTVLR